ncbi:L,D-transpeptidase family protein [Kamptonema cortianum]|nr:L,D-transpeptidase family protein [Geitlerinema splendidum]MDK3156366.1 L,D-transpeptidase family protein [Kamptonema cortianum]
MSCVGLAQGRYDFPILLGSGARDAITFPGDSSIYVPIQEVAEELGVDFAIDRKRNTVQLGDETLQLARLRELHDGTVLMALRDLGAGWLIAEERFEDRVEYRATRGSRSIVVAVRQKWVEISLSEQRLLAFQGDRLVLDTNISSGKPGHRTPTGYFKAGPEKSRMRYSSKYDNSPMPYALQVNGDIFIHGYTSVPKYPASHGCIRMPLTGRNAARHLFEWVEVGISVAIVSEWSDRSADLMEQLMSERKSQKRFDPPSRT